MYISLGFSLLICMRGIFAVGGNQDQAKLSQAAFLRILATLR